MFYFWSSFFASIKVWIVIRSVINQQFPVCFFGSLDHSHRFYDEIAMDFLQVTCYLRPVSIGILSLSKNKEFSVSEGFISGKSSVFIIPLWILLVTDQPGSFTFIFF
jgi:hypothetical protein